MDLHRKETIQVDLSGPLIQYARSIVKGVEILSLDERLEWIEGCSIRNSDD